MKFVLASGSPRRREILTDLGYRFTVQTADFDEASVSLEDPAKAVRALALGKATAAAKEALLKGDVPEDTLFLGSDTVVALQDKVLGKPADEADARRMLSELSGKTHTVYTGVAAVLVKGGDVADTKTLVSATDVSFYDLSEETIESYVATGEPLDKAGAYGIQGKGCILVEEIRGDYLTVVGLPAAKTFRLLESFGILPEAF